MKKEPIFKQLLTPNKTGEAIGVTGRTILNLEARGIITADIRVGKIVRFDLDRVKAQLAAATQKEIAMREAARSSAAEPLTTNESSDRQ